MKLVDSIDEGAPDILVNGVSNIERVSPELLRMSFFRRRSAETVEVCHLVWGQSEWRKFCELVERVRESVLAEPPVSGMDDHPSRDVH